LHAPSAAKRWSGTASVERGGGLLSRLLGNVFGFPAAGEAVPVSVEFTAEAGGERWTRTFAGRRFSSLQTQGQGRNEALLVERFGAVSVALAPSMSRHSAAEASQRSNQWDRERQQGRQ